MDKAYVQFLMGKATECGRRKKPSDYESHEDYAQDYCLKFLSAMQRDSYVPSSLEQFSIYLDQIAED